MSQYVIYSRKSLEDDDKQIQSIPDQERAMRAIGTKLSLSLVESLSESKSAKAPGRAVFNDMMNQVETGKIDGILCWKLDRLARNPVDGGRIIWAIKQHGLVVRTPHQTFSKADDNLILMYIEFGMAQKYVDDLSRNTTRGLESKAQKGWQPGIAPLGYLNSKIEERGQRTILRDPERFDAVRRMWDHMLTGNFSPARIQTIANHEWGFRTRQTKRTGGKPVSRSAVYKIFSSPFYYGRFEYPHGSGQWFDGQHEPMISKAEFDCVQRILHKDTNPRPQTEFAIPFRGLLKCGECGSSITAHVKEQLRCTKCHFKSSIKRRAACFRCGLAIADMKAPKTRRYVYYHCTRTLNAACRQKCIPASTLELQVTEKIKPFALSPELQAWGVMYIEKLRTHEVGEKRQLLAEKQRAYEQCVARLENLVRLKTSPENADNSLLSDEEYQKQRAELLMQKGKLASATSAFESELDAKTRIAKEMLNIATDIQESQGNDDVWLKRGILSALGLNHVIFGKDLVVKPEFPFSELASGKDHTLCNSSTIEPEKGQRISGQKGRLDAERPAAVPDVDEDRTRTLKSALDKVWKKLDPQSHIFQRFPFNRNAPVVPKRKRERSGRFGPISREDCDNTLSNRRKI